MSNIAIKELTITDEETILSDEFDTDTLYDFEIVSIPDNEYDITFNIGDSQTTLSPGESYQFKKVALIGLSLVCAEGETAVVEISGRIC